MVLSSFPPSIEESKLLRVSFQGRMNKKMIFYEDYLNIHEVVLHWNEEVNPQGVSKGQFRALMKKKYLNKAANWANRYTADYCANRNKILRAIKSNKIILHQFQLYSVIKRAHETVGHKASKSTHNYICEYYGNITHQMCLTYIKFCPTCAQAQNPIIKKMTGAQHPIESYDYRDRFQWDLIDFQNDPQPSIPGVGDSPICR